MYIQALCLTGVAYFKDDIQGVFPAVSESSVIAIAGSMVKVLAPDTKIVSYALSGKNGAYKTATFTPQTSNSYYAVVTPVDTSGVNGTVSAYN